MASAPRLPSLALCVCLCVSSTVAAQSGNSRDTVAVSESVAAGVLALSADFEGALDQGVNTAYFCKGVASFIAAPTKDEPDNKALLLTLDPSKSTSIGRCDPQGATTERTELAEPDDARLPLGTEIWYGFRFMIPAAMKGKFAGDRLVIAQLKQHPNTCRLGPEPLGLPGDARGNPTVSFRLIEEMGADRMGVQLAVSGDEVRKASVGQLLDGRDRFLESWHEVLLHVKIMPRDKRPGDAGFVEGWLDGQRFADGLYGILDGAGTIDQSEPFGFGGLVGCTYFKYGIYRDARAEPWTIAFDRFRRGATREAVESSVPTGAY